MADVNFFNNFTPYFQPFGTFPFLRARHSCEPECHSNRLINMLHFDSDYMRGCHPEILERLSLTNMEQTPGYGNDRYTAQAKTAILEACGLESGKGDVVFLVGGTQTNATVIDLVAGRYDAVISVDTGHINVHESGAVEASGHKVITLPSRQGKMNPDEINAYMTSFYADETWEHMARPGMVYATFPTEVGTIYSLQELLDLKEICNKWKLPLYIDGARLAYGLAASPDVKISDIAAIADIFYIGGTKCGTLFGEAVVTRHPELFHHVLTHVKAHGALMAKGRLLGLQFEALFSGNLYDRIGRNGVDTAMALKKGMLEKGHRLFMDSPTNQQFFILSNEIIDALMPHASFELWGPRGETETPVRFVTDWGTTPEDIECLLSIIP